MKFVKFTLFSLMLISIAPSLNAAKVSDFKAAAQKTNSYVSRLTEVISPSLRKKTMIGLSRAANVAKIVAGASTAGFGLYPCTRALDTLIDEGRIDGLKVVGNMGMGTSFIISGLITMKSGYDGLRK